MDAKLLQILVCPVTKGSLIFDKKNNELISKSASIPAMSGLSNAQALRLATLQPKVKRRAPLLSPQHKKLWPMPIWRPVKLT